MLCRNQNFGSQFSTYYSHIKLAQNITDNAIVQRGQLIGTIALYPDHANCRCDWANSLYECSSGPHAHFELRKNGYPVNLDGRVISTYRIRAGTYSHDIGCSDPDSCDQARINGSSCATTYTDIQTDTIFCPTVKGQNLGEKDIL